MVGFFICNFFLDKPQTWCKKVPKKICAPDNCKMVPGKEECHDKNLVSTIQVKYIVQSTLLN